MSEIHHFDITKMLGKLRMLPPHLQPPAENTKSAALNSDFLKVDKQHFSSDTGLEVWFSLACSVA